MSGGIQANQMQMNPNIPVNYNAYLNMNQVRFDNVNNHYTNVY